jgi:hypothetical protein
MSKMPIRAVYDREVSSNVIELASALAIRAIALAVLAAGCRSQVQDAPPPTRTTVVSRTTPAASATTPGSEIDDTPVEAVDVASWPRMKMRTFEGSVHAFNGSSTPTRFTVSLAAGFVLSSSSELGATYLLNAKGVRDGALVGIHMDGRAPDIEANAARTAKSERRVTKKEKRADGYLLESEDAVGTSYVEVAISAHGETLRCTVDLYTTQVPDKLVPWAETMCSSVRIVE